jgi:hypothetical protein
VTATQVDGVPVVADEPATAPMRTRAGQPIRFTQIRHLLLEDGSEAFGCAHCDYASRNPLSIRPHLNKHRAQSAQSAQDAPPAAAPTPASAVLDLRELVSRLDAADQVAAERDEWRTRALKAERDLARLRAALKRAGA